jgi:hypothetical protein
MLRPRGDSAARRGGLSSLVSSNPLYAVCIQRAARLLGGYDALGARLDISPQVLERWAEGYGIISEVVFLQVVDILLEAHLHPKPPPAVNDNPANPIGS